MKKAYLFMFLMAVTLAACMSEDEKIEATRQVLVTPSPVLPMQTVPPVLTETAVSTPTVSPRLPVPVPTSLAPLQLDDTLILYSTVVQADNWALKAYPDIPAFAESVFDSFYGPKSKMDDVRRYTQFNFGPQLSPNGRYLLLPGVGGYGGAEYGGGNTGLWFVSLQTDEVRQLLPQAKVATWSPYGDQITYVDGDTLYTLSVAENATPKALFTHPNLWSLYARWSPDGNTIATMSTELGELDKTGYPKLTDTYWLVDVNSGQVDELAVRPGAGIEHVASEMDWSPTGRYLLVRNEIFDLNGSIAALDLSGRARWLPVPEPLQAGERERLLVNGRFGFSIHTIEGTEVARISDTHVDYYAISHDGRKLAYINPLAQRELLLFDLATFETLSLGTISPSVSQLRWSGQDEFILLDEGRVWAMPAQPGGQAQILPIEGRLIDALPMPSKDVEMATAVAIPAMLPNPQPPIPNPNNLPILFARDDDLWRTDMNGNQVEQLTEDGALGWGMTETGGDWQVVASSVPPQVSPNGRWIAFAQGRRTLSLFLVDVDLPGQLRQVDPGALISAWSPDSKYLAYGVDDSLFLYDVENDILHQLLDHIPSVFNVVWSPDMRDIAFACCFETPQFYRSTGFGEIRRVKIGTGRVEIVDATRVTVGSGIAPVCWGKDGQVVNPRGAVTERCSYTFYGVHARSPDNGRVVSISPASKDDAYWEGDSLLTVRNVDTDEIVWQQQVSGHADSPMWSPDGAYVIFQRDNFLEDTLSIWRVVVGETAVAEMIVENGYLLEVLP